MKSQATDSVLDREWIAERYEVLAELGQGGMAVAYRVRDRTTGRELALKRLNSAGVQLTELFEREFHTLSQLAHPRIPRAFDYGWDGERPYYTMELLDGGDLRELAPLPWQEVAAIAYGLCSALSLLHSRRLLHRDVTPRNVRRTSDGAAKLLDFGLLSEFGPSRVIAGTPPYVAPEVVNKVSLDARSDLFSLGATLYFALTGRTAFRAASFDQLRDVWRTTPRSPRALVPDIPEAFDQLVLSLIRVDAGSRPKSAAEVMEHLRPLLGNEPDSALEAAGAHLTAPAPVARDELVVRMRKQVYRARAGRGGGFLIAGAPGTGRSRVLDLFVVEAKLMGAVAVRAGAREAAAGPFGVARGIVEQVHDGARPASLASARADRRVFRLLFGDAEPDSEDPPLLDIARAGIDRTEVQAALHAYLSTIARTQLLALAVDDLDMNDGPSAALLGALSIDAADLRLAYCVGLNPEADSDAVSAAVEVLQQRARTIALAPLSQPELRALLSGVFGEVPNLDALSRQLHDLSGGKPRECMLLAQHLVDRGVIRHAGGAFLLPEAIDPGALPEGVEGALSATFESLAPAEKTVARLLCLGALGGLSRAQLASVEGLSTALVDDAVDALRRAQAIAGSPQGYRLCQPACASLMIAGLDPTALAHLHDLLAELYRESGEGPIVVAYHALQGERPEASLDALLAASQGAAARTANVDGAVPRIGVERTAQTFRRALAVADRAGRGDRVRLALWPSLAGVSAAGADVSHYELAAAPWLPVLKSLSGYDDWCGLSEVEERGARAMQAFVAAAQRFEATPEAERLLAPADAIKELVAYVVFSIAIAVRTHRPDLAETLPGLLAPFAPLSPIVHAMQLNAEATRAWLLGRQEETLKRQTALVGIIDALEGDELTFLDRVRAAVCQAIAWNTASLGIDADPDQWLVSDDATQRVGGEYIKKVVALHRGDWDAAEAHRRRAELITLQHDTSNMFSVLREELEAHALARDLTGLRGVRERLHKWAESVPSTRSMAMIADAFYHHLCGEPEAALARIDAVRALRVDDGHDLRLLPLLETAAMEILLARGEVNAALSLGQRVLSECEVRQHRHAARQVACVVALAEAKCGRYDAAKARIGDVLAAQEALNVRGLLRGRAAEYLARCAIAAGDRDGFNAAATLAAEHYQPGHSAVLGALHERLMEDARRAGLQEGAASSVHELVARSARMRSRVETDFKSCEDAAQRAQMALEMMCDGAGAQVGHLCLLTEQGLSECAALPPQQRASSDMLLFAQARLEMELDSGIYTLTAADPTGAEPAEGGTALTAASLLTAGPSVLTESDCSAGEAQVCDPSGQAFKPVVLLAERGDEALAVGVLLLPTNVATDGLNTLASAVAQNLIDAGDCRPLPAA